MIRINLHEVKTHLSRLLARLRPGEVIIVCRCNVPIAEIRPLIARRSVKRPIGLARRTFTVPPTFFHLPEEEVAEWEAHTE